MRARPSRCKIGHVSLRVLIVDDNESFLDAARVLLEREHLCVVGVASTVADAVRRAEALRPDVALVDITLGGESGLDLTRLLIERNAAGAPAVILVSTHAEEDVADLIADCSAVGFLSKSELSASAIRRVLDGAG